MASEDEKLKKCVFCKISSKEQETRIIYEDEETLTFKDLRPATDHHYLVIPKQHYGNPKSLTGDDLPLVEKLMDVGKKVLVQQNANTEDTVIGFHWPPFNSIQHLHLHVISDASQMRFASRHIYRPGSWWFATVDWMLEHLKKMKSAQINTKDSVTTEENIQES
ncbi:predicted protein [Nematostella vectensis]|uniref:Adenosine 5'-monophosphoramidase HINT3 n=1 Tax=Nematostella vectensis TaxID=45351 RepID=A7SFV5_NEMVE|nr:predicted protein [Nematostella vectensis]|eukprot:XP_001629457.1 predicted protein [Nematostella vectensis]